MKEKKETTKIVKGSFRATLALIVSIIALIFSMITYNRTISQTEYQTEINALEEKLRKIKQETAERVSKISQETASALKKLGVEIKKQAEEPAGESESSENQ